MFQDEARLVFRAGNGGDGVVSWRREKYIPKGGPYGGDGGNGGNVVLVANPNLNTLSEFRHKKIIKAETGERGYTKTMHGKDSPDLVVGVPVGTLVKDALTKEIIVDLSVPHMQFVLCRGGRGGFGNAHFMSSTRQAPDFAELGDVGEEKEVLLELKLVADIGIIGLPNAGKSTLIQELTNVRPKIADYPFTTLVPNLGVMEYKGKSLVLEDVPGLIEGAHTGKGLGKAFLKHIERASVLLHAVDISVGTEAAWESYQVIRKELTHHSAELAKKEEIVLLNKIDIVEAAELKKCEKLFAKKLPKTKIIALSGAGHINIDALKDALLEVFTERSSVQDLQKVVTPKAEHFYDLTSEDALSIRPNITRTWNIFEVKQPRVEQIVRMTNMQNTSAVMRVYDVLDKTNILRRIVGIVEKDLQKEDRHLVPGAILKEVESGVVRISGREFSLNKALFGRKWFIETAF